MDPNAALEEIRSIINRWSQGTDEPEDMDRLCELVSVMDDWLASGGFLPDLWKTAAGEKHWQYVLKSTNDKAYNDAISDIIVTADKLRR